MKSLLLTTLIGTMLLGGCTSTKKTTTASNRPAVETNKITGIKWMLIEIQGNPVAATINDKEPFILLEDTSNRYSASGGCNGLGGTFTISENGRITFSQGMSTMMACPDMKVETALKKVLQQTDNYTISGDTLSLNKARMAPLARFIAVTEDKTTQLNGTWELDYISGAKIAFDGLYPTKKPVIAFSLPDNKATGNSSCNNFNVVFSLNGSNIKFNDPTATLMACPGMGESAFFKTLKTITKYSITGDTLNLIMGDIAVMRFHRK